MLILVFFAVFFGPLFTAMILRASCDGYNKIVSRFAHLDTESSPAQQDAVENVTAEESLSIDSRVAEDPKSPYAPSSVTEAKTPPTESHPNAVVEPGFGAAYVSCMMLAVVKLLVTTLARALGSNGGNEKLVINLIAAVVVMAMAMLIIGVRHKMTFKQSFFVVLILFTISAIIAGIVIASAMVIFKD